jgi:hypothetical protein
MKCTKRSDDQDLLAMHVQKDHLSNTTCWDQMHGMADWQQHCGVLPRQ